MVAAGLAGCSPVDLLNATVPDTGVSVVHGLAYGPDPRQRLDVYRAAGDGARPVVVFFYGGSWRAGRRSEYPFVAEPLARQGFVVVVADYRLYPQVEFPAFLQDCALAVAWTLAHAGEHGGDAGRVVIAGHSAGAYNAVMLGLDPALLRRVGVARSAIAGVVGIAGPYDFLPITDPAVIPVFASVQDGPTSQPITYVDGRNPPMLLLAGTADETVNPQNTVSLARAIRAHGGPVEMRLYPGVGHIGIVIAFAPLFRGKAPVLADVSSFVRSVTTRARTVPSLAPG